MGALHEGHLSLIRRARAQCDRCRRLPVRQPGPVQRALGPRPLPAPGASATPTLAAQAGADLLFAPSVEEIYPPGFATAVEVLGITDRLEGATRGAAHFRGVTTVVTKLLCMALPDVAYFGQKDAQQVRGHPPPRRRPEPAGPCRGLPDRARARRPGDVQPQRSALTRGALTRALALPAALRAAERLAARGRALAARCWTAGAQRRCFPSASAPEYLALVDPDTLEPVGAARRASPAGARRPRGRRSA